MTDDDVKFDLLSRILSLLSTLSIDDLCWVIATLRADLGPLDGYGEADGY